MWLRENKVFRTGGQCTDFCLFGPGEPNNNGYVIPIAIYLCKRFVYSGNENYLQFQNGQEVNWNDLSGSNAADNSYFIEYGTRIVLQTFRD